LELDANRPSSIVTTRSNVSPSIAVVGGGAAGIAAAFYLRRKGCRVDVIECGSRLGGRMATARLGARDIALGGKNIGRHYSLFRDFVREMGNQPFEYFGLNSSRIRDGHIVTFDGERRWSGLFRFLRTCTAGDAVKVARMAAAIKCDPRNAFLGAAFFSNLAKRRCDDRIETYLSRGFCQEIVRPMSVRMNGAEPNEIGLGNFGTNLCMIFDTYDQLRDGLEPLFERFAQTCDLRLATTARSLVVRGGRVVGVQVEGPRGVEELQFDHVVLAIPACHAAELVRPHGQELARRLDLVRYFPVGVVVAEYDRPIFDKDVRALVFPRNQPLSNAGAYGINDRHIVRYTFSGAAARGLLASDPSPEGLLARGERILSKFAPVGECSRASFVGRVMQTGLCAYALDHAGFIVGIESALRRLPGLELTGDYLQGASIEACFRASLACAERLAGHA
jgi:oxygen-dependent protoporphyrinogen oxidase